MIHPFAMEACVNTKQAYENQNTCISHGKAILALYPMSTKANLDAVIKMSAPMRKATNQTS